MRSSPADAAAQVAPPGIIRRLASLVYEGVLLFGVVMVAGLFFAGLTQQRHALQGKPALQATLFVVIGAYLVWSWTHGGQTLAMKTWKLRLECVDGSPVGLPRALVRYLLCWLWFVPGLSVAQAWSLKSGAMIFGTLATGVLAYAGLALLRPDRQFWHDVVCRTRIVATGPRTASKAESPA